MASVTMTRRELLIGIGVAAAAACHDSGTLANRTDQPAKGSALPAKPETVTLVVSGMV